MFLLIAFRPGEILSIGDVRFGLNAHPPQIVLPDGSMQALTETAISPVPDVTVALSRPILEGAITLRFQAPKGVPILRHPAGDAV